jgi:hypothetical protein
LAAAGAWSGSIVKVTSAACMVFSLWWTFVAFVDR